MSDAHSTGRRLWLLSFLTILVGISGAFALLLMAEVGVRIFNISAPLDQIPVISMDMRADEKIRDFDQGPSLRIPTHLPKFRFESRRSNFLRGLNTLLPQGYFVPDSDLGWLPKANTKNALVTRYLEDGSFKFSARYSIDSDHRRVTPGQEHGKRSLPLLFLGCSFTFGQGLNDQETLPAQAARLQENYRVYNYGFEAWGPANILALVRRRDFASDIPKNQHGKAVYLFIDDHVARVIGTLSLFRASLNWTTTLPYMYFGTNGELERRGMLSDRPFIGKLYKILSQSRLLSVLGVQLPPSFGRSHFQLFVAILEGIRDTLREKVGTDFTVAFYPSNLARVLIPMLEAVGIRTLDYSRVDISRYIEGPAVLPDGHPSAEANRFLAEQMLDDLGLARRRTP